MSVYVLCLLDNDSAYFSISISVSNPTSLFGKQNFNNAYCDEAPLYLFINA